MCTVDTISRTRRNVALGKRDYRGQDEGESRRVLSNGTRQRDSKRASQCMLLGKMERRRMDMARPKSDNQRIKKTGETEVRRRKRHQAQAGR